MAAPSLPVKQIWIFAPERLPPGHQLDLVFVRIDFSFLQSGHHRKPKGMPKRLSRLPSKVSKAGVVAFLFFGGRNLCHISPCRCARTNNMRMYVNVFMRVVFGMQVCMFLVSCDEDTERKLPQSAVLLRCWTSLVSNPT